MVLFYIVFAIFVLVAMRLVRTALWMYTNIYWYNVYAVENVNVDYTGTIDEIKAEAHSEFNDGIQFLFVFGIASILSYINTLPFNLIF